jgi:hypothetical protein
MLRRTAVIVFHAAWLGFALLFLLYATSCQSQAACMSRCMGYFGYWTAEAEDSAPSSRTATRFLMSSSWPCCRFVCGLQGRIRSTIEWHMAKAKARKLAAVRALWQGGVSELVNRTESYR